MDELLEAFCRRRRRHVLLGLWNGEVEDQADVRPRGDDPREAELALIHNHLPRLEKGGFIEWDRDSGTISKGPDFDTIEPLLRLIVDHADELPPDWP